MNCKSRLPYCRKKIDNFTVSRNIKIYLCQPRGFVLLNHLVKKNVFGSNSNIKKKFKVCAQYGKNDHLKFWYRSLTKLSFPQGKFLFYVQDFQQKTHNINMQDNCSIQFSSRQNIFQRTTKITKVCSLKSLTKLKNQLDGMMEDPSILMRFFLLLWKDL